jgi:hypothetical protein
MAKVIEFFPTTNSADLIKSYPKPAIGFIPAWYKSIKPFSSGDKKLRFPLDYGSPNLTLKRCVPFLDSITSGYMYVLSDDIYVEQIDGQPFIRWRTDDQVITWHSPEQFEGFYIPTEYTRMVAKWHNEWVIKTPKGYNILFTHPSNRFDLPFHTITGLVDSDLYSQAVQFPFILRAGFEGIIEAGTPVCQLFLIKNEHWKSKVLKFDISRAYIDKKNFFKTFVGSYKKNFWKNKIYQ